MIEAEIRRERWRRALDLAIEATRVDRYGRTTDVLAFVVAQVFGQPTAPRPTRAEVDEALAASRAEHRRLPRRRTLSSEVAAPARTARTSSGRSARPATRSSTTSA